VATNQSCTNHGSGRVSAGETLVRLEPRRQNRVAMGHNYSLTTIKGLFGQASRCAYPDCPMPLVFVDEARGVRAIAVHIAHIRSPRSTGPRYDPTYPTERLNEDENLLLLCPTHHHPVDQNDSAYTTQELLAWKEAQQAQGGGFEVADGEVLDLAQRLEEVMASLLGATQLNVDVSLVGGYGGFDLGPSGISVPLAAFPKVNFPNKPKGLTRYLGVEVVNTGLVAADVTAAGIEFDVGQGELYPHWQFPDRFSPYTFPHRLKGRSSAEWFVPAEQVRATLTAYPLPVQRFRALARLSGAPSLKSKWEEERALHIWE
jgi:hypothetical protein